MYVSSLRDSSLGSFLHGTTSISDTAYIFFSAQFICFQNSWKIFCLQFSGNSLQWRVFTSAHRAEPHAFPNFFSGFGMCSCLMDSPILTCLNPKYVSPVMRLVLLITLFHLEGSGIFLRFTVGSSSGLVGTTFSHLVQVKGVLSSVSQGFESKSLVTWKN